MLKLWIFAVIGVILSNLLFADCQNAYDSITATWNTQGSKWDRVKNLLKDHDIDVLALQECGNPPDTATILRRKQNFPKANANEFNIPVNPIGREEGPGPYLTFFDTDLGYGPPPNANLAAAEYEIESGSQTRGQRYYLYHYSLPGALNSRTNLAIVSKERADEVFIMKERIVKRPAVGIRIGSRFYFSIHAGAFGANPVPDTVYEIDKLMKRSIGATVVIMGDFNREPTTWSFDIRTSLDVEKVYTNVVTHSGNSPKILDYAVMGTQNRGNLPQFRATRLDSYLSDHYAVMFEKL